MTITSPARSADLFVGRYRLLRTIGEGTAATVYLARDLRDDRLVALKVLESRRLRHPRAYEQIDLSARLWQQIRHSAVVALYDWDRVVAAESDGPAGEVCYLALEHVRGRPLRWHLQARGPLAIGEAVTIARQILAGLSAAHSVGLIHQDLRPQNVLLAPDGTAKVSDFGLAEAVGYTSPHYVSPEHARRARPNQSSDIYAVGVILFEMLADAVPFDSAIPEVVLRKHAVELPPSPRRLRPAVPSELETVLLRSLAKRPEDRWPDAAAMSAALEPFGPRQVPGPDRRPSVHWTAMLAPAEQDLAAATPRDLSALTHRRLAPRSYATLATLALLLIVTFAYAGGWRVRISTLGSVQEAAGSPATPVATEETPPGKSEDAAARPTPGVTVAGPAISLTPAVTCVAPEHANPAVAETYRAMVEDACGSPVWETVREALDAAVTGKVEVDFGQPGRSVYGLFEPSANRVTLAQSLANEAPSARAAILLHEFVHVRDYHKGDLAWGGDVLACYDVEYRAFRAQASFWSVSRARHPSARVGSALEADLDYIARAMESGSASFIARDLVARYGSSCSATGTGP